MRTIDLITTPPGQYYVEELPSDEQLVKESDHHLNYTLSRIYKMRSQAMMKGYDLKCLSDVERGSYLKESGHLFSSPEIPTKKDLPRIKVSDLKPLARESSDKVF